MPIIKCRIPPEKECSCLSVPKFLGNGPGQDLGLSSPPPFNLLKVGFTFQGSPFPRRKGELYHSVRGLGKSFEHLFSYLKQFLLFPSLLGKEEDLGVLYGLYGLNGEILWISRPHAYEVELNHDSPASCSGGHDLLWPTSTGHSPWQQQWGCLLCFPGG